ncbi:MAG: T9SS type A sorting domain-containing protein [Bacteroidia bacterium]
MKKIGLISILFLICGIQLACAQEVKIPLLNNPILKNREIQQANSTALKKKATIDLPFIDFFEKGSLPSNLLWADSSTFISNRYVVFDSYNETGQVYSGVNGIADRLTSKTINLSSSQGNLVLSFSVQAGVSFVDGDSLVLEALSANQVWTSIWSAGTILKTPREIYLSLDPSVFKGTNFSFRFSFLGNFDANKVESFLLSKLVLANQIPLPFYSNFQLGNSYQSAFVGPDISTDLMRNGSFMGQGLVFDALDKNAVPYSGSYGGADTLLMHSIGVSAYPAGDSLFLGFSIEALPGAKANDSLILEFRNNLGVWTRNSVYHLGNNSGSKNYQIFVNSGRNRHPFFRARWILKSSLSANDTAKFLVGAIRFVRRISLPFVDDFSSTRVSPDRNKWVDSFVFINNQFPVEQASLQVATFDGLNQFGNAYSKFALKADADFLHTYSLNLSALKPADSVYLSFYYQYELQGETGQVFPDDSFSVMIRNNRFNPNSYHLLWQVSAKDASPNAFVRIDIPITDTSFFHDDVQIRFKNRGSLSGNLSHWHLDYVRFDKGRRKNDAFNDVSLTNTPPVRLGMYASMPWKHYQANKSKYGNDSVSLRFVNHDQQTYLLDYFRTVTNPEGAIIEQFNNVSNILFRSDTLVRFNRPFVFTSSFGTADSLVFNTTYKVGLSSSQKDAIPANDTFSVPSIFSNYLAYDDGTAEAGYGIKNKTNCGAALKYVLEVPDTLYGMYVFFNQSESNVSNSTFNLKVWKSISRVMEPANDDVVLYKSSDLKPVYTNKINGFAAFKIEPPIAITDSFYIGWEQTQAFVLNIGIDKNFPLGINRNMFFKQDGQWYPTELTGALMMRPIVGKWIDLPASIQENKNLNTEKFVVYPNPSNGKFHINSKQNEEFWVKLYDLSGRELTQSETQNQEVDLSGFNTGVYLLKIESKKNSHTSITKIIIQP